MRPLIISAPEPRTLELIFTPADLARLRSDFELVETTGADLAALPEATLNGCRYLIGQPPIDDALLKRFTSLRCIFNVESNLIDNMPYERLFERGIHVVTTGAVFAVPVAELGLAMALNLLRGVVDADLDFRHGHERWGGDGNQGARTLTGKAVGIVGFGDLGRAVARVLEGFQPTLRVYDPWLPASTIREHGAQASSLDALLEQSEVVFVTAAVTSENQRFLDATAFARMPAGALFILLSRADVVDFEALMDAVESGHLLAASDVYPEEPLAADHRVRRLTGFLRSAHRAGALDSAFVEMGARVLDDLALLEKGLPPQRCKRAERETVSRMRSRPVEIN